MAVLPKTFEEYDKRKDDLKAWFEKFGNWQEIDANQNIQELHVSFASIIGEKIVEKKKFMEDEKERLRALRASQGIEEKYDPSKARGKPIKDREMCQKLHKFWDNLETSYIRDLTSYSFHIFALSFTHANNETNTKTDGFELLRHERRRELAYVASTREYFFGFLRRPDSKQELVDAFQKGFNAIDEDLRKRVESKEELHLQSEELSCQLFDLSVERKNEAVEVSLPIFFLLLRKHCCVVCANVSQVLTVFTLLKLFACSCSLSVSSVH